MNTINILSLIISSINSVAVNVDQQGSLLSVDSPNKDLVKLLRRENGSQGNNIGLGVDADLLVGSDGLLRRSGLSTNNIGVTLLKRENISQGNTNELGVDADLSLGSNGLLRRENGSQGSNNGLGVDADLSLGSNGSSSNSGLSVNAL